MNESVGLRQGYYVGLFARFLWHFIIFYILHSMIFYVFGYNWFTYYVLAFIFSFLINTSLPMGEGYPFFRNGLILTCIFLAQSYSYEYVVGRLMSFFIPDPLWGWLLLLSLIFGIMVSFGRYNNGIYSRRTETFGRVLLFAALITAVCLYWWKGGLVYILFRLPLILLDVTIANLITIMITNRYKREEYEEA